MLPSDTKVKAFPPLPLAISSPGHWLLRHALEGPGNLEVTQRSWLIGKPERIGPISALANTRNAPTRRGRSLAASGCGPTAGDRDNELAGETGRQGLGPIPLNER